MGERGEEERGDEGGGGMEGQRKVKPGHFLQTSPPFSRRCRGRKSINSLSLNGQTLQRGDSEDGGEDGGEVL